MCQYLKQKNLPKKYWISRPASEHTGGGSSQEKIIVPEKEQHCGRGINGIPQCTRVDGHRQHQPCG